MSTIKYRSGSRPSCWRNIHVVTLQDVIHSDLGINCHVKESVSHVPYKMILETRPQGSDLKNLLADRISVDLFPNPWQKP